MFIKWFYKLFGNFQVLILKLSSGRFFANFRGMPILLLVTKGRVTGKKRIAPVMYIRDGENYVVTASNNGFDDPPNWLLNLQADPQITIEVGGRKKDVTAKVADPQKKSILWTKLVEKAPFFDGYRKNTSREIPMVILQPTNGG
jgi:deazaflavin-dependent oxidoreductase (nitroreductase family)